ncbi:TetR family transcriptional regulator C-terminal domain-containing protein [Roseovarius sp. S4756]|uniref:TetR family transcriptional regulator C-terminal domain-containing protein n=1 Tax=Roseovarius maritimus TaxID=3342637 RepID=UPI003727089B
MTTQEALRSRRFAPPEVRRQQLIDATIEALAHHGVSGTTMAEVTRRAGLSMGIVSLHFQSKDNLLTSTLRHLSEEYREVWAPICENTALPPTKRLASIIAASFDPVTSSPTKMKAWFAFFGETRYRLIYDKMVNEFDDERIDAMERLCAEIIAEGGYDDVCPEAVAASIECLCDGLWLSMILCPGWLTPEGAQQQVMDIVARHFPHHFALSGAQTLARRKT